MESSQNRWPTVGVDYDKPRSSEAAVSVSVEAQFSKKHPARVGVEYRNVADRQRTVSFGSAPPFSNIVGESDAGHRLVIVPERSTVIRLDSRDFPRPILPERPIDGCWRLPDDEIVDPDVEHSIRLYPGSSVSETYCLLDPGNDTCLPAGTYGFGESDHPGEEFGLDVVLRR